MVNCRYCSSEVVVKDESKYVKCPWCHNCFYINSAEPPSKEAIYRARYTAELERRKQYEMKHSKKAKPDPLHYKISYYAQSTIVKGIKIIKLKPDNVYAQSLKKPLMLLEKVAHAANVFLSNPHGNRMFYSHVDIPELKCSIILKAIYFNGLTIGYHELTDQLYIRPRGSCWQKFDLGD